MNYENESKKFYQLGYEQLEQDFQEQIQEIIQKRYIFKILNIVNKIDKYIKEDLFKNADIYYIKLKKEYNEQLNYEITIIDVLNKHKHTVSQSYGIEKKEYKIIKSLLTMNIKQDLCNDEEEIDTKIITLEINNHTKEHLKYYFLNTELKKICDYIELSHTMNDKIIEVNKETNKIKNKL